MKLAALFLLVSTGLVAQTITITAPTSNQTISGFPFTFAVSTSALPGLSQVQYLLDQRQIAVVRTPPFSYAWPSTAWRWNGTHEIYANALDVYGNVLATSAVVVFVIDNSGGTEILSVTPSTSVNSTWSGTVTLSITGGVNGNNLWIDGYQQSNATSIDTTKWFNGPHYIYSMDTGPGNSLGKWSMNMHAMWAHQVTFNNGSSGNVELRTNASYLPMLPNGTFQLTCTLVKTDQSTTPCTSPSWTAASPGSLDTRPVAVSVNASTGLVTAGSTPGDATVTVSANGLTDTVWVSVNSSLTTFPQFSKAGTILQSYDPANSIFPRSWWNFATPSNLTSYTGASTDYINGGANTVEDDPIVIPALSNSQSQATWKGLEDATLSTYTSFIAANPSLYLFARADNWGVGSGPPDGLYTTSRLPWSGWTVGGIGPPAQYITQTLVSCCHLLGFIFGDEVNVDSVGRNASPAIWTPSSSGGSIVCTSGTCVVNWGGSAPANWGLRTNSQLIITGSAHNAAINNATGATWTVTAADGNCSPTTTITFTGPAGVTDTWNASNDPNLSLTVMGYQWYNIAGIGPDYVRNDSFTTLMSQIHAGGGMAMWPENGGALAYEQQLSPCQLQELQNVQNRASIQDFSSMLYSFGHGPRWDAGPFINDPVSAVYSTLRAIFAGKNRAAPIVAQVQGTPVMYKIGGVPVPIASYSNGIVTFSQPHGFSLYKHGVTRLTIQGSSTTALNNNFLVVAIPSATTLQVALVGLASGFSGAKGVATFADGTVIHFDGAATGLNCPNNDKCGFTFNNFNGSNSLCANFKYGQTFVVTGAGSPANNTYWYRNSGSKNVPCTGQQPTIDDARPFDTTNTCASSCGTGYIINDNDYVPGRNSLTTSGTYPDSSLSSLMAAVIYGAGAVRGYSYGTNEDDWAVQNTGVNLDFQGGPTPGDGIQPGAQPLYNFGGGLENWTALSEGYNWIGAFEKYILQPQQAAPDYGGALPATVRTGSYGAILIMLNTSETTQTRTVNLAPWITGANTTSRYKISQFGTTVGTTTSTTDTVSWGPGETIAWIFPVTAATPIQPVFSPKLSAVSNAAHIAVEWAYDPHLFPGYYSSNHEIPVQTAALSCDSGCTIPADARIKQIYYRYRYLDASGRVLATSDIMTIAKS